MKLSGFRVGKPKPSMSDFDYLALDTAGRERRGSVKAASMDDARAVLGARKLYVVRMEPGSGASAPPLLSGRALFRKTLSAPAPPDRPSVAEGQRLVVSVEMG